MNTGKSSDSAKEIRILKRDVLILIILVGILFGLVFTLFIRINQIGEIMTLIIEDLRLLSEGFERIINNFSSFCNHEAVIIEVLKKFLI